MQAQWQVSQPNRQVYAYRREIQVLVRLPNERAGREMVAFCQDRSKMDGSILLAGSINQGDVYRRQRTRRTTGKTWLFPPTKGDTKTTSTSTRKAVLRYTPLPLNTNRSNVSPLHYLLYLFSLLLRFGNILLKVPGRYVCLEHFVEFSVTSPGDLGNEKVAEDQGDESGDDIQ